MKDYRVYIPDEHYTLLKFEQDNLPGIASINTGLKGFEPKVVFEWHLSIIIDFEELIENGMPSPKEQQVLETFEEELQALITGVNPEKPNALYLGRITWNATRQILWRVYNPELVNEELQKIIEQKSYPRRFDYRMESDKEWKLTEWHLQDF